MLGSCWHIHMFHLYSKTAESDSGNTFIYSFKSTHQNLWGKHQDPHGRLSPGAMNTKPSWQSSQPWVSPVPPASSHSIQFVSWLMKGTSWSWEGMHSRSSVSVTQRNTPWSLGLHLECYWYDYKTCNPEQWELSNRRGPEEVFSICNTTLLVQPELLISNADVKVLMH